MRRKSSRPEPCDDCGHPVYPTLLIPVRRRQDSCRVLVSGSPAAGDRCGCTNPVHSGPTMRPRHRLDAGD